MYISGYWVIPYLIFFFFFFFAVLHFQTLKKHSYWVGKYINNNFRISHVNTFQ